MQSSTDLATNRPMLALNSGSDAAKQILAYSLSRMSKVNLATAASSAIPYWKFTDNGDGTFHQAYVDSASVSQDLGDVAVVSGKLPFAQSGVTPNQNYHYDITAFKKDSSTGELIQIGDSGFDIKTPADGSGTTIDKEIGGGTGDNGSGSGGGSSSGSHHGGGGGYTYIPAPVEESTEEEVPNEQNDGTIYFKGSDKCVVVTKGEVTFSDVLNHWSELSVTSMASKGIIEG